MSWEKVIKRKPVTMYNAFVMSLKSVKTKIENEQIDEALEYIEKTLDMLSRMDDPELK